MKSSTEKTKRDLQQSYMHDVIPPFQQRQVEGGRVFSKIRVRRNTLLGGGAEEPQRMGQSFQRVGGT